MMGQELFENPRRQYELYRVEVLAQSAEMGVPSVRSLADDEIELSEAQEELLEAALEANPEDAITFDAQSGLWIRGTEDDINRMFADRDEFLDALEAGEDPGV